MEGKRRDLSAAWDEAEPGRMETGLVTTAKSSRTKGAVALISVGLL